MKKMKSRLSPQNRLSPRQSSANLGGLSCARCKSNHQVCILFTSKRSFSVIIVFTRCKHIITLCAWADAEMVGPTRYGESFIFSPRRKHSYVIRSLFAQFPIMLSIYLRKQPLAGGLTTVTHKIQPLKFAPAPELSARTFVVQPQNTQSR